MDSSSNRSKYRSPTPKITRYLHRIEQIMGNRPRTPSPLSSKVRKSMNPSSLDHYLKYELTFKILIAFVNRKITEDKMHFFSNLRVHEKQHVQKIYRFVSIEKLDKQNGQMSVDATIAGKILLNYLKALVKAKKKQVFQHLHGYEAVPMVQSKLIDSHRTPLSNGRILKLIMFIYAKKQLIVKDCLSKIRDYQSNSEKKNKTQAHLFYKLSAIRRIKLEQGLTTLKHNWFSKTIKIGQLSSIITAYYTREKSILLASVKDLLTVGLANKKKSNSNQEKQMSREEVVVKIYDFTNIVSVVLFSYTCRSVSHSFKFLLQQTKHTKQKQWSVKMIQRITRSMMKTRVRALFYELKNYKLPVKEAKNLINFQHLTPILKFSEYGLNKPIHTLQFGFQLIKIASQNHNNNHVKPIQLLLKTISNLIRRKSFNAIRKFRPIKTQNAQKLYGMLNKLVYTRIISAFVKLKTRPANIPKKTREKDHWRTEVNLFLDERKRNQQKFHELLGKINEITTNPDEKLSQKASHLKLPISSFNLQSSNIKLK